MENLKEVANKLNIYCGNKSEILFKNLIENNIVYNNNIYTNSDIPTKASSYLKSVFLAYDNINDFIKYDDIFLISYNNLFTPEKTNIVFITEKYIGFKEYSDEYPHILPISSIISCEIEESNDVRDSYISLELTNGDRITYYPLPFNIDEESVYVFSFIKYYIDNFNNINFEQNPYHIDEIYFPKQKDDLSQVHDGNKKISDLIKPTIGSKILFGTAKLINNNPLFGIISKLDGKAIIIVAFLRNNAPERVLNILTNIPGVNVAAGATKAVLGQALNWFNNMLMKHGESYIMEQLVTNFKKRGIKRDKLYNDIDKDRYTIFGEDIVEKSTELLDKYMPDEDIEHKPVTLDIENNNLDNQICSECGSQNKTDAKFCSNCGTKLIKEYKCSKCGYSQQDAMKFCPECGSPI